MIRRWFATMILAALTAGTAHAAEVITAPFYSGAGAGDVVGCKLLNVTAKSKDVRIRIVNGGGSVLSDSGFFPLAAGNSIQNFSGSGIFDQVHCRFEVKGPKNSIRAMGTRISGGNDVLVVPAN